MTSSFDEKRRIASARHSVRYFPVISVWTCDITYIATDEGWLYLAGLKDVFTCEIVGYVMGERMTTGLVS